MYPEAIPHSDLVRMPERDHSRPVLKIPSVQLGPVPKVTPLKSHQGVPVQTRTHIPAQTSRNGSHTNAGILDGNGFLFYSPPLAENAQALEEGTYGIDNGEASMNPSESRCDSVVLGVAKDANTLQPLLRRHLLQCRMSNPVHSVPALQAVATILKNVVEDKTNVADELEDETREFIFRSIGFNYQTATGKQRDAADVCWTVFNSLRDKYRGDLPMTAEQLHQLVQHLHLLLAETTNWNEAETEAALRAIMSVVETASYPTKNSTGSARHRSLDGDEVQSLIKAAADAVLTHRHHSERCLVASPQAPKVPVTPSKSRGSRPIPPITPSKSPGTRPVPPATPSKSWGNTPTTPWQRVIPAGHTSDCPACNRKIFRGELITVESGRYVNEKGNDLWYHLDCEQAFKERNKKILQVNPNEVSNPLFRLDCIVHGQVLYSSHPIS